MYRIHFSGSLYTVWGEQKKIAVHTATEHISVHNLRLMALTWPELCFAFHVDIIRRLSLINQAKYQPVFCQFKFCHVYTASEKAEGLSVFEVSKAGIVYMFIGDGAFMEWFITTMADMAGRTGNASDPTENDLSTDICFSTMISINTEVVDIAKGTFVIPVTETVLFDLLRNSRRILTQEACDIFEGRSSGKFLFNVKTVL